MRQAKITLSTGIALVVLVLSGCTSATTATTGPQPAASTVKSTGAATGSTSSGGVSSQTGAPTVVTDPVNRFSVTLPAGYRRITDKAQLAALIKAGAAGAGQRSKAVMDQYAAIGANARVFAFKPGTTGFANNLNILVGPAGGADAEHVGDLYLQLKPVLEARLGAKITDHRVETVARTKALRVEYRLTVAKRLVRGTQIYLIHDSKALVLSISQNDVATSGPEADAIIDSLRFL